MPDGVKYEVSESITAGISPERIVSSNYDEFIRDVEILKQTYQSDHEVLMELIENLQSMSSIYEENYNDLYITMSDYKYTQDECLKLIDRLISDIGFQSSYTQTQFNSLWTAIKIGALIIGVLLGGWIIHVL